MADEDIARPGDEVPAEGSEQHASGPSGPAGPEDAAEPEETVLAGDDVEDESSEIVIDLEEDDTLTVDDILDTEQTEEAAEADEIEEDPHLADLKRLQAEYANYRRRTEEQRHVEIARAKGEAVKGLLPVLDDLDRAAKHGDLEEGSAFAAVATKVRGVAERLGVHSFGVAGEVFDPQHHEAIFQQPTPGATETTVLEVVELGYRLGDVELRPAKVVVAVPAE